MSSSNFQDFAEDLEELTDVLSNFYVKARTIHLSNEAITGERDWMGMSNFRDALDHIGKLLAGIEENDDKKVRDNLVEVKSHIHRAVCDGAQVIPEKKIEYIEKNRLPSILYEILLYDAPDDNEYKKQKRMIKEYIQKGRQHKPIDWSETVKNFEQARDLATKLEEQTPPKKELFYRLIILLSCIFGILGFLYLLFCNFT